MKNSLNIDKYYSLTHKFAKKIALQRCLFELEMHQKFLDHKHYSFDDFKSDVYSPFVFSSKELDLIYKTAVKQSNYSDIDKKLL